jgi:CheY-like chemotaxis protein
MSKAAAKYIITDSSREETLLRVEAKPHQSTLPAFEHCSILVAEDNLMLQALVRNTLERWKIQTTIAANGVETLSCLRKNKYDLIIMDIEMPEMDGLTATQIIRSEFLEPVKSIPIIAMTAAVFDNPVQHVINGGMNDYIAKPFQPEILHSKITYWFNYYAGREVRKKRA